MAEAQKQAEQDRAVLLFQFKKKKERPNTLLVVSYANVTFQEEVAPPPKKVKKEPVTPTGVGNLPLGGSASAKPKLMPPPAAKPQRLEHYYTYATTSNRVRLTPQNIAPPYVLDPPEVKPKPKPPGMF